MIGEQIKNLRLARNMSQVDLAVQLSVSKQSISNWENNNILPSIDVLKKVAAFFSCSTDYLLEIGHGEMTLDISELTLTQSARIQELVNDFNRLNKYQQMYNFKKD